MPYQTNEHTRMKLNNWEIRYSDIHLSHFAQEVRYGFYGKVDVAVIEAAKIAESGQVVLTTSIGASPVFCQVADAVIIEINTRKPVELEGIHDIYQLEDPPHRKPIPLVKPDDMIGSPTLTIDLNKIKAIVFTLSLIHI